MSEDFKEKLREYTEGRLPDDERKKVEDEIEKMEQYQAYLDEIMGDDRRGEKDSSMNGSVNRIVKRGKWRARFHNALTALAIVILFTMLCGIFTTTFYNAGKDRRTDIYRDVVSSTVAVTQPNVRAFGGGRTVSSFFAMKMDSDLYKMIGSENIKIGRMTTRFLLNRAGYPERERLLSEDSLAQPFIYPGGQNVVGDGWKTLGKLPDGTVAEAFISLDKLYKTDEILGKFKDRDMTPLWFAVDTGFDKITGQDTDVDIFPIGFPYMPLWHSKDFILVSHTEKKGTGIIRKIVSETKRSPDVEPYGSGAIREKNFMDTLALLKKYEGIVNRISNPDIQIGKRIDYINKNGINIYGIVVTGPTKEILKLRQEPWVTAVRVGEVKLWNWND